MARSDAEQTVDGVDGEQSATATAPPEGPARSNGSAATTAPTGLGAPAGIRPSPVPAGAVLFGELTTAFVDGTRLLRHLGERRHTGALVDTGRSRTQVAILHDGGVVALLAVSNGATVRTDRLTLPAPGEEEEHDLRVITYRPEIVVALSQLINVAERFERMHGSFVDLPALVTYLRREKASGAIRVTGGDDTGVILLRSGDVLGAFTSKKPELDDADVVLPLAKARDAEIDVHTGPISLPPATTPVSAVV